MHIRVSSSKHGIVRNKNLPQRFMYSTCTHVYRKYLLYSSIVKYTVPHTYICMDRTIIAILYIYCIKGRLLSYFIRVYLSDPSSSKKRPRNEKVEWNVSEVEEIVECCGTYIELLPIEEDSPE